MTRTSWTADAFVIALGLAAAMGVGRFVFTPLLPVMTSQAGMTEEQGAVVATANYLGYLLGALALSGRDAASSQWVVAGFAVLLTASEALMGMSESVALWCALRLLAGVASAVIFIACTTLIQKTAPAELARVRSLSFSGVGIGIALTGAGALIAGPDAAWQQLWTWTAVLSSLLLLPLLLSMRTGIFDGSAAYSDDASSAPHLQTGRPSPPPARPTHPLSPVEVRLSQEDRRRVWVALMVLYFAEGLGYIVIGTFLVDAVASGDSDMTALAQAAAGNIAWLAVGLSAIMAPALWTLAAQRTNLRSALAAALIMQTAGAVIPALTQSPGWAVLAALLFGATFAPITMLALGIGAELGVPRAAAKLTAAYSVGQVLGPLVVIPVLGDGYTTAFWVAAAILTGSTLLSIRLIAILGTAARQRGGRQH